MIWEDARVSVIEGDSENEPDKWHLGKLPTKGERASGRNRDLYLFRRSEVSGLFPEHGGQGPTSQVSFGSPTSNIRGRSGLRIHLASQWGSRKNTRRGIIGEGVQGMMPPPLFSFSFSPTLSVRIVQSVERRGGRVWPGLPVPSQEG